MAVNPPSTTTVKWDDVAGLEPAKSLLKEAVVPWIRSAPETRARLWKGILLFGPPGTGKSLLAKALASEITSCSFITVRFAELISKLPEEPEQRVKSIFQAARDQKPSILCFDDIECFCRCPSDNASEWAHRIKTEFLKQVQETNLEGVLVLGATNVPGVLDAEVLCLLEEKIYIPLPDENARTAIFKLETARVKHDLTGSDYWQLGTITDGYSGADIFVICREAQMLPVREVQTATHFRKVRRSSSIDPDKTVESYAPCSADQEGAVEMTFWDIPGDELFERPITMNDMIAAISRVKPSTSAQDLATMEEFIRRHGSTGS